MTYAYVNGIRLNYDRIGKGDTAILITGFGGDLHLWNSMASRISKSMDVITLDNRGAGLTEYNGGFRLEDISDDIVALMDHLSIESAHVLGWSMGSHIAVDMAAEHGKRVKTLTVASSYRFRPARSMYVLSSLVEAAENGMPEEYIGRMMNGFCMTEDFFSEKERNGTAVNHPIFRNVEGLRLQLDAINESDVSEKARKVSVPTLSVHGLKDVMVEPSEGDALSSLIRNCDILRIPDAGHIISPRLYAGRFVDHTGSHPD